MHFLNYGALRYMAALILTQIDSLFFNTFQQRVSIISDNQNYQNYAEITYTKPELLKLLMRPVASVCVSVCLSVCNALTFERPLPTKFIFGMQGTGQGTQGRLSQYDV